MIIRNQLDDLLPGETGESLGRLLIDYQELEEAIRSSLDVAYAAIDPLGIVPMWGRRLSTERKIETAKKVLDLAAKKFGIPVVDFNGTYPIAFYPGDTKDADERVAQAFAAMRCGLPTVRNLMDYRNTLFHGRVKVEGSELQFIGKPGQPLGNVAAFQAKRQEVQAAIWNLLLAANSLRVALAYLVERDAKPEQS